MGLFDVKIKSLFSELDMYIHEGDKLKEALILTKLLQTLTDQEMFWLQKSRLQWIKEGDRNTTFFIRL